MGYYVLGGQKRMSEAVEIQSEKGLTSIQGTFNHTHKRSYYQTFTFKLSIVIDSERTASQNKSHTHRALFSLELSTQSESSSDSC